MGMGSFCQYFRGFAQVSKDGRREKGSPEGLCGSNYLYERTARPIDIGDWVDTIVIT